MVEYKSNLAVTVPFSFFQRAPANRVMGSTGGCLNREATQIILLPCPTGYWSELGSPLRANPNEPRLGSCRRAYRRFDRRSAVPAQFPERIYSRLDLPSSVRDWRHR